MYTYTTITDAPALNEVSSLVSRVYVRSGYLADEATPSAISDFLRNPNAVTIGAYVASTLVGTVSIVPDGERGLPMDSVFADELKPLRNTHASIAEVCQFAVDNPLLTALEGRDDHASEKSIAMRLLGAVFQYCLRAHISHVVFAINPKHKIFYEALGAHQIGEERSYGSVNNAPALGYMFDLSVLNTATKGNLIIQAMQRSRILAENIFPEEKLPS